MIQMIILNSIIFILFPTTVMWKFCYNKSEYNMDVLTLEDSSALRGVAAIFIMFAHYLMYVDSESDMNMGPAKLMQGFGGLGVCLFFFLSGYGLYYSATKRGVKIGFLGRRFRSILPTYFILRILFGLILGEYGYGMEPAVQYLFGLRTPLWFVDEIVIIYLLFFIAAKISMKKIILILAGLLAVMSVIFLLCGLDARWYNANMVFILGMLFAKCRKKCLEWLSHGYIWKLIVCVLLFMGFAGIFVYTKTHIYSAVFKLMAGGFFCVIFFMILMKFTIRSTPIIYIGKKSLEFYMVHIYVWLVANEYFEKMSILLKFTVCIMVSILITCIYGKVYDWILKKSSL
ncbi:MAG: acyltransferase [Lachnospiraceae bacterium]|nr:acyltransferase [Lachnospiraceae bacterium]